MLQNAVNFATPRYVYKKPYWSSTLDIIISTYSADWYCQQTLFRSAIWFVQNMRLDVLDQLRILILKSVYHPGTASRYPMVNIFTLLGKAGIMCMWRLSVGRQRRICHYRRVIYFIRRDGTWIFWWIGCNLRAKCTFFIRQRINFSRLL